MPKPVNEVAIRPGKIPYVDERLGISEYDEDQMIDLSEETFHAKADVTEGVSGRKYIDTRYENTSEDRVGHPRSDRDDPVLAIVNERANHSGVDKPAGQDIDRWQYPVRRY